MRRKKKIDMHPNEEKKMTQINGVHTRFSLTATSRVRCYANENDKWVPVEGCKVTLGAVQGEPFGSATPSGSIEMLIVNQTAAQMFLESPLNAQFDVTFSPVKPDK